MAKENHYDLQDFIREVTAVVERADSDQQRMEECEQLMARLMASSGEWLAPEKRTPSATSYSRHTLYEDPHGNFEILALIWQPGQSAPPHDHDGTWGVQGILEGQIRVTNYERLSEPVNHVIRLGISNVIVVGEGATARLIPPADCHAIAQEGERTAITIHLYGKKLLQFKVFELLGDDHYAIREHHVHYS